jgi:hypothetical protein
MPLAAQPRGLSPTSMAILSRSTVLALYNGSNATNLDTQVVLNQDSSLVFEQGIWRNTLLARPEAAASGRRATWCKRSWTPRRTSTHPNTNLQQLML